MVPTLCLRSVEFWALSSAEGAGLGGLQLVSVCCWDLGENVVPVSSPAPGSPARWMVAKS